MSFTTSIMINSAPKKTSNSCVDESRELLELRLRLTPCIVEWELTSFDSMETITQYHNARIARGCQPRRVGLNYYNKRGQSDQPRLSLKGPPAKQRGLTKAADFHNKNGFPATYVTPCAGQIYPWIIGYPVWWLRFRVMNFPTIGSFDHQ